jgi:hypothetical protein
MTTPGLLVRSDPGLTGREGRDLAGYDADVLLDRRAAKGLYIIRPAG